jgi:hypothetical protein
LQQLSSGRDWLLFFLIQSCRSHELRKKILNLDDDEITLENVLALTRKYESTEVACNDKDTINNIFVKKEKKGGKARPSQPVQQPQATQSSTNVNAKANQTGAKRPCNHWGRSPPTSTGRTALHELQERRVTAQSSATTESV